MSDYLLYRLSIIPCLLLFLSVSYPKFPSGIISFLLEKLPFAIVSEQVSWLKSFLNFFLLRLSSFTFISKGYLSLDIEIWANCSFLLSFKQYCATTRRLAWFLRRNSWRYLYLSHMASLGPWVVVYSAIHIWKSVVHCLRSDLCIFSLVVSSGTQSSLQGHIPELLPVWELCPVLPGSQGSLCVPLTRKVVF